MPRIELTCPLTGEQCRYYGYCNMTKRRMGGGVPLDVYAEAVTEEVNARAPGPLLGADRSSFCSEKRVRDIGIAATKMRGEVPGTNDLQLAIVDEWEQGLTDGILQNRLIFAHLPPEVPPDEPIILLPDGHPPIGHDPRLED